MAALDTLSEKATTPEVRNVVNQTLGQLREVIDADDATELERIQAHLAIAEVIERFTHSSGFTDLDVAIQHLRAAHVETRDYNPEEPCGQIAPLIASKFGQLLTRRSEHAEPATMEALVDEAEDALRFAVARSGEHDDELPGRMCNLASHLLRHRRGPGPEGPAEACELLQQALNILDGDPREALVWRDLGHARRSLGLAAHDPDQLGELFDDVERCYETARRKAEAFGHPNPVALSDRALLAANRYEHLCDESALDDAIDLGQKALDAVPDDWPHRPEAAMQLAENHAARYRISRDEADGRSAARRSEASVESPHVQRHGAKHHQLKQRRVELLRTISSAAGDWGDERRDLRRLHDEILETDGIESPPETLFLRLEDDLEQIRRHLPNERSPEDAYEVADQLRNLLRTSSFEPHQTQFSARYAASELRLAKTINFHAPGTASTERLRDAVRHLQGTLTERQDSDTSRRFYGMVVATELLAHIAAQDQDNDAFRVAANSARATLELGRLVDDQAPTENLVEAAALAMRLDAYTNDQDGRRAAAAALATYANQLPRAAAATDLLMDRPRFRRAHAAAVATAQDDARSAAWAHLALTADGDLYDSSSRNRVLQDVEVASQSATQVFLSIGHLMAHAVTIRNGEWAMVELPDLAEDRIGPILTRAYRAHQAAATGTENDREAWNTSRSDLLDQLAADLAPLAYRVAESDAVDVHLAGLAHLVPIVPILARATKYAASLTAILPTFQRRSTRHQEAEIPLGAIVVPGTHYDEYLAAALEDAETIVVDSEARLVNPTLAEALEFLPRCRQILLAGHAFGSSERPGDSAFLLDPGRLTVADVLGLDLAKTDLVVFSSCESLSPDSQVHENPLSLATAALLAGANAAVGSHWRVGDSEASTFTRSFFSHLQRGHDVTAAYTRTLSATNHLDARFSLYRSRRYSLGD